MPKTNDVTDLPAPISLTLDEARQVAAAGTSTLALAPWWWFGQPPYLSVISQITTPVINPGQVAAFGH
jgi:hypothetical protein